MPIKRAALRSLRKDRKRAVRNQALDSELKTIKKQFLTLVAGQKREEAATLLPELMRRFDHAATKGRIHRNTVSRVKSRLVRRLASVQTAAPKPRGKANP